MTDSEIINHLKINKYSKAIKGLYAFFPSVKKFICANNGSNEDAEDIFQDVLVVLCTKVNDPGFQLTASLKTYLLSITRNLWFTELRRRGKFPTGQTDPDIYDKSTMPDETTDKLAEAAFNLLGEKCRQLLIQFYIMKKTFREIAASLSFSDEKIAKNQKYRCLQKAKENYLQLSKTETA